MKNLKKLFVALLALVASFGLISAVAAEGEATKKPGSITIKSTTKDKTYEIYKIFDLTYSGTNVAYTIDSNWTTFFEGDGAEYIIEKTSSAWNENLNQITITASNGNKSTKYINITDENVVEFTQAAFDYAASLPTSAIDKSATGTGNDVIVDDLDLGYYLVYPKGATDKVNPNGSICSLTSTTPSAEVNIKATYPTINKTVNDYSVEVGQTVKFTITGQVPDTTGYETYEYTIKDTMSAGLNFNSTISGLEVTFDGTPITLFDKTTATEVPANTYATIKYTTNGFELSFDMTKYQTYVGKAITVTYNAKVTEDAIDSYTTKNEATLTYSNDPKDATQKTTTPKIERYLYSADIEVTKVDGEDASITLEGAQFVLQNSSKDKYYKATYTEGALVNVEWVADIDDATVFTSDSTGKFTIEGVEDGTYYLVEIKAPAGYNLLVEPVEVEVANNSATVTNVPNPKPTIVGITKSVANYTGTTLPSTGGMGTTLFVIVGSLLAIVSVIILITNKRISKEF